MNSNLYGAVKAGKTDDVGNVNGKLSRLTYWLVLGDGGDNGKKVSPNYSAILDALEQENEIHFTLKNNIRPHVNFEGCCY